MFRRTFVRAAVVVFTFALTLVPAQAAMGQESGDLILTVQIQTATGTTTVTLSAGAAVADEYFDAGPETWHEGTTTHSLTVSGDIQMGGERNGTPVEKPTMFIDVNDSGVRPAAGTDDCEW